jgi:hypothetical protein
VARASGRAQAGRDRAQGAQGRRAREAHRGDGDAPAPRAEHRGARGARAGA